MEAPKRKTRSIKTAQTKRLLKKCMVDSAAAAIGTMAPGYRLIGVNSGQFSMIDLIEAIIAQVGDADVDVSTWTQGKADIQRIEHLLRRGKINKFRLLVDRSLSRRHPGYLQHLVSIAKHVEICEASTHAKIALIGNDQYKVTVRTSMNLNRNKRLEQFDIDESPAIYGFFRGVIDDFFNVIHRSESEDGGRDEWESLPTWGFDSED